MCDPSSEATFLPRGAISASLGFPLHSAEISMSSRFVGRPQAFPDRASRGALFLTSLLILALLSLLDRKSTRLNSSHGYISYAVFCLKKNSNKLADRDTLHPMKEASSPSRACQRSIC